MKKIKGMEIVPPQSESGQYESDANLPKIHQVCIAVGKRASGKTTAVVNLIEKLNFDYVIAVSPTMNSNKEIMMLKARQTGKSNVASQLVLPLNQ